MPEIYVSFEARQGRLCSSPPRTISGFLEFFSSKHKISKDIGVSEVNPGDQLRGAFLSRKEKEYFEFRILKAHKKPQTLKVFAPVFERPFDSSNRSLMSSTCQSQARK